MTELAAPALARARFATGGLFAGAVFMSAALVFLVEPMAGKLILPLLGGSPAVWNISLAFFQAALLAGYAYAHGMQRLVRSVRAQAAVHLVVLLAAGLALPLRLSGAMGAPPAEGAPGLWLLGLLTLSIGAPFAALSATAPLLQAWRAALGGTGERRSPYVLYAASNIGSLLALLAYPLLVEPLLTLSSQRSLWTAAYAAFVLLAAVVASLVARSAEAIATPRVAAVKAPPTASRERLAWVGLAAAPSSLMLGCTSHLATDVASAPFLWAAPLGLYLLTFVLAFQERPLIRRHGALLWQAPAVAACALLLPLPGGAWALQLAVHLTALFLTSLVCHQALAARKPPPERLTEFYLLVSLGGVLGGGFNAFLAPAIFPGVWEYPIVLAVAGLARPWGRSRFDRKELAVLAAGLAAAAIALALGRAPPPLSALALMGLSGALAAAFALRDRGPAFALLIGAALLAGAWGVHADKTVEQRRSFFGVHRVAEVTIPSVGRARLLFNGTTVHGAQMQAPADPCRALTYYAPAAPIGQALSTLIARPAALRIGVVGLGAGAVAAYSRPGDHVRFFEIDPAVLSIARDSGEFSYVTACAKGMVDYRLGDARLTLAREPAGAFDLLLIDAFSSDTVPTHLLTVEALRIYLDRLAPGGVLLLHLTNRNLDLAGPAAAVVREAGAVGRLQRFRPTPAMGPEPLVVGSTVMAVARREADLDGVASDGRWRPAAAGGERAWSDDYTNVLGALLARLGG